ncbi:proton-conducting transporter membrane subunit [Holophaga foetida]|uniref:proton-conducting transporter transmembrane domain-containing protein n=1 Tax=Holophaga foetida TaxID=35839 RepID=UPI00024749A5|nr:proton-conducting transporter membrane subunit [Holophaga foetida]
MDLALILSAMGCWLAASVLALTRLPGGRLYIGLGLLGAGLALGGATHTLIHGQVSQMQFQFWGAAVCLELDALSAAFILPLQVVVGLGCVYASTYWPASTPRTGTFVRFFYALLATALTAVFICRQGMIFLVAWELMAISAFFLVGTEHERPEVRRSSWIYLVSTHTGTLCLIALVVLLFRHTGSLLWSGMPTPGTHANAGEIVILLVAILGFTFKAGAFPLHFWLPGAHAGAPSHISAVLSAVMLKSGVYGILRISSLLPPVPHLGGILMILGGITALYGVACALAQRDYKRLLAYSSVENIGIIFMGIGLGWTGRALGNPWLAALGFGGAILHVWNHAFFKSLLFFGAGSVLHATGTRELHALGGLGKRMPITTLAILPGVMAVSALPPFNGFVSEWFLYRGFFASLLHDSPWWAVLAIFALALTGGLAGVAFAKFFGFLFLGEPHSAAAEHAHDPGPSMWVPMAILGAICLFMSLGSPLLLPLLDRVVSVLAPGSPELLAAGLGRDLSFLSGMSILLIAMGAGAFLWLRRSHSVPERPGTWDCGYAAPTARMQYTADSFSDGWSALFPMVKTRVRRIRAIFPGRTTFHTGFQDAVGDAWLAPRIDRLATRLLRFRRLQRGYLSIYILYILIALVAVFLWMLVRRRLLG